MLRLRDGMVVLGLHGWVGWDCGFAFLGLCLIRC